MSGNKKLAILICILVLFFTFSTNYILTIPKNTLAAHNSNTTELTLNERITEEVYLENTEIKALESEIVTRDSEILFGVENLIQSNTSVFLYPSVHDPQRLDPLRVNTTLAPGQIFTQNYTVLTSYSTVLYYCNCSTYPSNATVKYWYEVLYDAGDPGGPGGLGFEFLYIGGSLLLSMVAMVLIAKKKFNKKD